MILRSRRAASRASRSTSAPRPVFTLMPARRRGERGERVVSRREGVDPGGVAERDPAHARRVQVEVVGAGAPHRDHLELRAGLEHALAEAGVGADVDGAGGVADAADQLGLLVRPALGEDADRPEALGARVTLAALEDGGEVVRDDDHAGGLEKTAWAAETPAPASLR